jgi:hypothetical protein
MTDLLQDLLTVLGAIHQEISPQFAQGWCPFEGAKRHRNWHRNLFTHRPNQFGLMSTSAYWAFKYSLAHADNYTPTARGDFEGVAPHMRFYG